MLRVLLSGGPGSGCTSTARALSQHLRLPMFDSDSYFHKPTNPPFQEQYTPAERRNLLSAALSAAPGWILSGSVATWGIDPLQPTHAIFLNTPREVRLERLLQRQRNQFGTRIDPGGDMHEEHESFMQWAAGYEDRTGAGRNQMTDRAFLKAHCDKFLELPGDEGMEVVVARIVGFINGAPRTTSRGARPSTRPTHP
jgi:adenylate kinase family enzyme